jgi:hypothetical protein
MIVIAYILKNNYSLNWIEIVTQIFKKPALAGKAWKGSGSWQSVHTVGKQQLLDGVDPGQRRQLAELFAPICKASQFTRKVVRLARFFAPSASVPW